jgi:hypothetical protein
LENQEKVFFIARMTINIVGMLGAVRRPLGIQVTIGDLIVAALSWRIYSTWPVLLVADVCMT